MSSEFRSAKKRGLCVSLLGALVTWWLEPLTLCRRGGCRYPGEKIYETCDNN